MEGRRLAGREEGTDKVKICNSTSTEIIHKTFFTVLPRYNAFLTL